jgi:hypothetical protein
MESLSSENITNGLAVFYKRTVCLEYRVTACLPPCDAVANENTDMLLRYKYSNSLVLFQYSATVFGKNALFLKKYSSH